MSTREASTIDSVVPLARHAAEDFLFHEAKLIDEHRFDQWLDLWDTEGEILYWIPSNRDDLDPTRHISFAYENRERLEDRIFRLNNRNMHSQRPKSRMRRLVSNVVVTADDGDLAHVEANFIFAELRTGHQDVFNGRAEYALRRRNGALKIASKKVLLVNNDEFIDNLTFLL